MAANGMGYTTNIPITITASPPITSNSVQNPVHTVHNSSNSNPATSTDRKEEKTNDLLHAQVHKTSRTVPGQKDPVDRPGASSSFAAPDKTNWNDMDDDNDMFDADGVSILELSSLQAQKTSKSLVPAAVSNTVTTTQSQSVFDRVFTAPNPITETTATVPPFPAAHKENASHYDEDGKPVAGSFEMKWITIRVDMRSHSSHFRSYGLPKGRSNNLTSLRRVLFRASEMMKVPFTPSEMFVGMDKGKVDLSYLSKEEMAKLQEQIKIATAAAASNSSGLDGSSPPVSSPPSLSLSSSSIPSFWSHQFRIHFDTVINTKKAYALLSAMLLSPRVPSPRIITGIVYGFGFTSKNEQIEAQMQQHAWYEGGAPSDKITRRMQPMSRLHMFDIPQPCDGCFFSVAASEFPKFLLIPSLNFTRPITVERYTRSKTKVCYHCNQTGHVGITCASKEMKNAMNDIRDACIMCGSFDHVHASCPARDDPNATCIICKKGKHTVRACPQYKGTYKKVTPRLNTNNTQQQQQRTRAWGTQNTVGIITGQQQSETQTQTTSQITANVRNVRQQQQQRANNTHIAQQDKMIAFLQAQHVAQQKSIDTLTEQVATLTRLLTAHMIQNNNNNNTQTHGSIMHADDTTETETETDGTATIMATTTAKKATSKKKMNKPTQAINKAQNDITKGTPRVSTFFAPTSTVTDTNTATRKTHTHNMKETDTGVTGTTTEMASHTLLAATTATGNKKRRVEEEMDEDRDEPLVPADTSTAMSTPTPSATPAKKTRK